LVEAQDLALSVWVPGVEGASGATGYFGAVAILKGRLLLEERESKKGGDGA
jgi:hypothetical protein